ncbi:MAG: excinuclease ABC subunit UvrA [Sphaerochaeta sp.]|nr:excinuclease ABC subunit UvrA [Sphaerochaeta sp.]
MQSHIIIKGAYEKNLKHLSVAIPRNQLVVFTGVSGSGKTTLLFDVIFQESVRQYLEAMGFLGINKPKVASVQHLSPAIHISQTYRNRNPRSTVGTVTDIYTGLRMVYEKLSVRHCDHCKTPFAQDASPEEVHKTKDTQLILCTCPTCKQKMPKLTVSHFSFNTEEGSCTTCGGLGVVWDVDLTSLLDEGLTLEEGGVRMWKHRYKTYAMEQFEKALAHYGLGSAQKVILTDFTPIQRAMLLHGSESEQFNALCRSTDSKKSGTAPSFEGVVTTIMRRLSEHKGTTKDIEAYLVHSPCQACKGERLAPPSRFATVRGKRVPELSSLGLQALLEWLEELGKSLKGSQQQLIGTYLLDLSSKIRTIIQVGLGYLSLDRQVMTLSAGETQRLRLASALEAELTSILYILDEPTVGLHPSDTQELVGKLKMLRDRGNSVFVIEHDLSVIREADTIIELGPGAGRHGGFLLASGTPKEIEANPSSLIRSYLQEQNRVDRIPRIPERGYLHIKDASLHNLKHIDVPFPLGCFTVVTGLSGSGKTTLVFDILAKDKDLSHHFDQVLLIDQLPPTAMKRSNVATYMDFYTPLRALFAKEASKTNPGLTAKSFSFNSPGGRCAQCEGLGTIRSNLLFFQDTEVPCPLCQGRQFTEEVLAITYKGHSIHDMLNVSVEEAALLFKGVWALQHKLTILQDVGLGYLEVGQTLPTLSGGESQRLKLAKALANMSKESSRTLFLMDEPTVGLHPQDVGAFIKLLQEFVRRGATLIVVEHNLHLIEQSDWIVDLGPGGGEKGGSLLYAGPLPGILEVEASITARYLKGGGY